MTVDEPRRCTAFEGTRRIASGDLADVAVAAKAVVDRGETEPVLIFDDATARIVEVDFRGSPDEVRERVGGVDGGDAAADCAPEPARKPGRPKLGVVGREVTLLPRHWDWLNGQPGGASVALRKLVEEARRANEGQDRKRNAREVTYRFIAALAGDYPGFEEASRALFAGDRDRFAAFVATWPGDVGDYAAKLADAAF